MSNEYQQAILKNNAAIKVFEEARQAYRSQQIGDNEFLAARKAYDAAMAEFDIAFASESR